MKIFESFPYGIVLLKRLTKNWLLLMDQKTILID